jgi:aminoglycoside phosphotransferase (APT) family kinase protein
MKELIFKTHSQRFTAPISLDRATIENLLRPYTPDVLEDFTLLSEGFTNKNYKVIFKSNKTPVVLRIYSRDKSVLQKEMDLYTLVADQFPVSRFLYADLDCSLYPHPYAIKEWVEGSVMHDVILKGKEQTVSDCAFEAGLYLDSLRNFKFPQAGFFQEGLGIHPFTKAEKYLPWMLWLLNDPIIRKDLGEDLHHTTHQLVTEHASLLPSENDANLTHGDYHPANILVRHVKGRWKITAILDWEFSFAGSYLVDLGRMLRFSHKLPGCYEQSFIKGLEETSLLPKEWKKKAKLLDILSLLQLTHYTPNHQSPRMNESLVSLIAQTVKNWSSF